MTHFYITTPIYYVNDVPHIGHAYTTLACDVLARYRRLKGDQVMFLTGTDEHGQKVESSAAAKGLAPQDFVDEVSTRFRELTALMAFSNDDFIRTTEARHKKSAQAVWQRLNANDHIYLGAYAGWYSVRDEAYYTESELITGNNGEKLAPTGAAVEWVEEPSYFFKLSQWQDKLLAFYEANPEFVYPNTRFNEVKRFVEGGLEDLSISRTSFSWGVPVPGDDAHVMYVWLDALTNYLSALGFPDEQTDAYRTYWPADVHMVGKDILRFHAVFWPAFLMAAGLEPPKQVVAHGWWTIEGEKISKSLGNAIPAQELIDRYGLEQARYFLMREVPFGNDGNFSHESAKLRINSDLSNNIGNLLQRTLSMAFKHCQAQIPTPNAYSAADKALLEQGQVLLETYSQAMEGFKFHEALEAITAATGRANEYIDAEAPWALKKSDPQRMATVLYVLLESIRVPALLLQPFMPTAAANMLNQLTVPESDRTLTSDSVSKRLIPAQPLDNPAPVFPRLEDSTEKAA